MEKLLNSGAALDLSIYERTHDGDIKLPVDLDIDDKDLCLAKTEEWIWSVGRNVLTDEVLASTTSKFYQDPSYECLWLR